MVNRKFCDMCGVEIPHVPDDFCVEETFKLQEYGHFYQANNTMILFSVDLCHVCTERVKSFIVEIQSLATSASEQDG